MAAKKGENFSVNDDKEALLAEREKELAARERALMESNGFKQMPLLTADKIYLQTVYDGKEFTFVKFGKYESKGKPTVSRPGVRIRGRKEDVILSLRSLLELHKDIERIYKEDYGDNPQEQERLKLLADWLREIDSFERSQKKQDVEKIPGAE